MGKIYSALGLMSGTSMDGVDASIIQSDGETNCKAIFNKYYEYNKGLFEDLTSLRDKIYNLKDLNKMGPEIVSLEKEITLFHAKICNEIIKDSGLEIDFIGFHGQTIYHNVEEKISKQIGDGNLLSKITKNNVIYNFRQKDIDNGGEGAPLTPVFHKAIVKKKKIKLPVCILNIGGITNVTAISDHKDNFFLSKDLGPGNCLIDEWIRNHTKNKFDNNGETAKKGKINELILNQALDDFINRPNKNILSFDTKDFSLGFVRGLSLEDGAATLTDYTGGIIETELLNLFKRVPTLLPTSTTKSLLLKSNFVIIEFLINFIPSIAIPSAIGWYPGAQNASRLCANASMPVAAVNLGDKSKVRSGSRITIDGNIFG